MELFSVLVLCYNNSQHLYSCLDSILKQNYPEIEIIVADDCSKIFDGVMIEKYCQERNNGNIKRVLAYSNPENFGTVKNANTALSKSKGIFFKVMGGDDQLAREETLTNAADALRKSGGGFIISDVLLCDSDMNVIGEYKDRLKKKLNSMSSFDCFKRLCIRNVIVDGGVFIRKDFFEKYGYFDEDYRLLEDWPMWLKATHAGCKPEYYSFEALKYRADEGVSAGINPVYMADRRRVLEKEIIPRKDELGLVYYAVVRVAVYLIHCVYVRKIYSFLTKRNKA